MSHLIKFLHDFLPKKKILTYLEIGTREGDSLKAVIEHNPSLKEIIVSDIWGSNYGGSGRGNHIHISELLKSMNFLGSVVFLDGDSKQTIPSIKDKYSSFFDLILVDGDHSYEGGMIDLENVFNLCKPNGIILFDDISHPAHLYLDKCFDDFVNKYSKDIKETNKSYDGYGVGVIVKS
jgi:hypothetical protein